MLLTVLPTYVFGGGGGGGGGIKWVWQVFVLNVFRKLAFFEQFACDILCHQVLSTAMQGKYFFALNLSSLRCSHIGLLFTNEEQEKLGS